jgi:hypothetical protein
MQTSHPSVLAVAFLAIAGASVPGARGADTSDDRHSSGSAEPASGRPRLTLAFVDCAGLPDGLLSAVQAETAALVAAMGVDADTRTLPPGSDLDPEAVTLIVLDAATSPHLPRGVMGAVQRQGAIPALWIYSANVAAGSRLGWNVRARWTAFDRAAFATAMARVAVHEVVHLVCPWREHDRHGLMAGVLDQGTLTGSRLPFSRELRRDFTLGVDALAGDAFSVARGVPAPRH